MLRGNERKDIFEVFEKNLKKIFLKDEINVIRMI
jgi:hypothetical protein